MYSTRSACYQRFHSFAAAVAAVIVVAQTKIQSVVVEKTQRSPQCAVAAIIRIAHRAATCFAVLTGLMMQKWIAAEVEMYWYWY